MFSIKRRRIKDSMNTTVDVRLLLITFFVILYKGKLPYGFTVLYNNRILITCSTKFSAILPTQPYYRPVSNLIIDHVATIVMIVFVIFIIGVVI